MWLKRILFVFLCLPAFCMASFAEDKPKDDKGKPVTEALPKIEGVKGVRHPSFSPDGKKIAFTYLGDIWTVDVTGGKANRLTLHEAYDVRPYWSPDGTKIAFLSNRSGSYDIWLISPDGGKPEQLTFHAAVDIPTGWTPDSKYVLFESSRSGDYNVWAMPVEGGTPRQITFDVGRIPCITRDGKTVIYTRGYNNITQRQYKGSGNWDLFSIPFTGGVATQLTATDINEIYPFCSPKGDAVYYISEDEKYVNNIFKYVFANGKIEQVTKSEKDILNPALSPDGATFAFEQDFYIWTMPVSGGELKQVKIEANSDAKGYDIIEHTLTDGAIQPDLSRDGRYIAFSMGGDIWIMPSSGGKARRLTSGPENDQWPKFSPDSTRIAFFSNPKGNSDIFIIGLNGGAPAPLTDNPADEFYHNWSPDGKGIIFSSDRTGNRDIWFMNLNTGENVQLTTSPASDDDPAFSEDGSMITFDSGRSGNTAIWVMPAKGGAARQVSSGTGLDQVPGFSPDGKMIVYESNRNGLLSLYVVSINGGTEMQITADGGRPTWTADGRYIIFEAERKEKKGIYLVDAPANVLVGREIPVLADVEISREQEYAQIFEEAWLNMKNGFYDEKLHGIDWDKIKEKYLPMVKLAENKEEMYFLVTQMIGELKASHTGFYGQGSARGGESTGYLGISLSMPDDEKNEGLLVTYVVPNSPADKMWIRKGDYIFSVDGVELKRGQENFFKLLNGKVNKDIRISISNDVDRKNAREVAVKLMDPGAYMELLYSNEIEKAEKLVKEKGEGKIAYIRLREMMPDDLNYFQNTIGSDDIKSKEALVLDLRANPGGRIHQQVLDILTRTRFAETRPRGGKPSDQPSLSWEKPVVLLINERSFSDAEVFTYGFKKINRGKVIGVATSGGVIGTNDITLSDGSTFRIPCVGWFGIDGTNLEGFGVKPDIEVRETPYDRASNRDPQLEKAIEVLQEEMKALKAPVEKVEKPEDKSKPPVEKKDATHPKK
ncbi:MAG: PD40 domain-containing protein [Planctomycetes bacterium]|nr:PD40 domain-containing protein [Planctomycetota bacterium]